MLKICSPRGRGDLIPGATIATISPIVAPGPRCCSPSPRERSGDSVHENVAGPGPEAVAEPPHQGRRAVLSDARVSPDPTRAARGLRHTPNSTGSSRNPAVADHLASAREDILAFTGFPKDMWTRSGRTAKVFVVSSGQGSWPVVELAFVASGLICRTVAPGGACCRAFSFSSVCRRWRAHQPSLGRRRSATPRRRRHLGGGLRRRR